MCLRPGSHDYTGQGVAVAVRRDDHIIVTMSGEHDVATAPVLAAIFATAIGDDHRDLVVDLSLVGFMDASTIGVLLHARSQLERRARSLAVRAPSSCARRLIDLCHISDLVEPEADAPRTSRRSARLCLQGGPASLN